MQFIIEYSERRTYAVTLTAATAEEAADALWRQLDRHAPADLPGAEFESCDDLQVEEPVVYETGWRMTAPEESVTMSRESHLGERPCL